MKEKINPIPEEFTAITPLLRLPTTLALAAIDFYKSIFSAQEVYRSMTADGKTLLHAELMLGSARFYVQEIPSAKPIPAEQSTLSLVFYVQDVERFFKAAIGAGAVEVSPVKKQFWGDRYGVLRDPFGIQWGLASREEDLSPEEIQNRARELFSR